MMRPGVESSGGRVTGSSLAAPSVTGLSILKCSFHQKCFDALRHTFTKPLLDTGDGAPPRREATGSCPNTQRKEDEPQNLFPRPRGRPVRLRPALRRPRLHAVAVADVLPRA